MSVLKAMLLVAFTLILFDFVCGSNHNISNASASDSKLKNFGDRQGGLTVEMYHQRPLQGNSSSAPQLRRNARVTEYVWHTYKVLIGIGTFRNPPHRKNSWMMLDTGSSLTWLQCKGCNPCIKQKDEAFPYLESSSYEALRCNSHKLCTKGLCEKGTCAYKMKYADKTKTQGFLAREVFTFPQANSNAQTDEFKMIFGCGIRNSDPTVRDTADSISGIFGLGRHRESFVKQREDITKGRFSYCFVGVKDKDSKMFLRFGEDVVEPQGMHTAKLYKSDSVYNVQFSDIAVAGEKLQIQKSVLNPVGAENRGLVIDSGSSFSTVVSGAYRILIRALKNHFERNGNFKEIPTKEGLCYKTNRILKYHGVPTVTFYLGSVKFTIPASQVFERENIGGGKERYCLRIDEDEDDNLLGAYQQTNVLFVYDTIEEHVKFLHQECGGTNGHSDI